MYVDTALTQEYNPNKLQPAYTQSESEADAKL